MATLTPLASLHVSRHFISSWEGYPNTSVGNRPLIIYHSAFAEPVSASRIESHLHTVGVVKPHWRYTMYDFSHYHSTTHEVLCVSAGRARLCFGGERNPDRFEPVVGPGDVMIVPAGLSHRLLEDVDSDFQMVGSYPHGFSWDMCHGTEDDGDTGTNIQRVPWFGKDPIYGHAQISPDK